AHMAGADSARYVIIREGVHGLSTGWHLAKELKARGKGSGDDVLILDKTGIGAGPSGLACGVVRNNYFQPAMRRLMAHNVSIWESDPEAFHYHPVGFMQISPEVMHADVAQIFGEQQAIGYDSVFVEGEDDCQDYMRDMFPDWQAQGITSVLHEKKGGYAENMHSMRALAGKAQAEGVEIRAGVRVTGVRLEGGSVVGVETDQGYIACEQLIVGAGPWVRDIWQMLDLPATVSVLGRDGTEFERFWTSGLAHCHERFEGKRGLYRKAPTGGIGAFTPDNFPVFDRFRGNAYVIADSNHGYKMIGVGALVAKEMMGERQDLLEPFQFGRYATGKLH